MAYGFNDSKEKFQLNFNYKIQYAPRIIEDGHDEIDYISAVYDGSVPSESIDLEVGWQSSAKELSNPDATGVTVRPFLDGQNMLYLSAVIGGTANIDLTIRGGAPQDNGEVPDEWTKCCEITVPLGSGSVTLEIQLMKDTRLKMRTKCLANTSGLEETTGTFTFKAGNWYITG